MSIRAYTLQTVIATARRIEEAPPEQVLAWALEEFHPYHRPRQQLRRRGHGPHRYPAVF